MRGPVNRTQEHAAADALSAAERRHLLRRLAFTATAALVGGVLTITGDRFTLLTAADNEFQGRIRIDATQSPGHLDFFHDDGLLWEAIFVAQPGFFRLNYVEADMDTARPTMFATTVDTPGTVIVMQR